MKTYSGMKPHVTMPEGLRVRFYNSEGVINSTLTANYAISYEKSKIMEARNDVVVVNSKGEKLNTEHLVWNQRKSQIVSEEFVKITTDDRILFGEGLKADETMNNWTIKKPKGEIYLEEDFTPGNKNKKDSLQAD
jgi:LPS export ABC transporter protein LptC